MNKYEEAFIRIDATTSLGLKDTIVTELGTATIDKEAFRSDMAILHELVQRATPMKMVMKDHQVIAEYKEVNGEHVPQYYRKTFMHCGACDGILFENHFKETTSELAECNRINGGKLYPYYCPHKNCGQAIDWSDK